MGRDHRLSHVTCAARRFAASHAIGVVLGLLFLFPILTEVITDADCQRHLQPIAPMDAGLAIQRTMNLHELPIRPGAGLGVPTAWTGGALLCGVVLLHRRDP